MKPWAGLPILEGDSDQEVGVRELATGSRRKRVVHVESATTGTFFKVKGQSHASNGTEVVSGMRIPQCVVMPRQETRKFTALPRRNIRMYLSGSHLLKGGNC